MELRHLRYFLAVAEEGNFTRAAAKLGIGQPPLSQQIRDLENEIGVALFHRVPHGAELTAAGTAFLGEAKASLAAAEKAKLVAQGTARGETGRLALGFTASSAFNPTVSGTIRKFRARWPDVRLTLTEMNSHLLMEKLVRGEVDAAFIRPGLENSKDVRMKRLADEPMLIALPSHHPLAVHPKLPISALANEAFVLFPRIVGLSLYDDVVEACRNAGFEMIVAQEAPQMPSVVNLVAADLGVSIVPTAIAQIKLAGVTYRPIEGEPLLARLGLVSMKNNRSPLIDNLTSLLPDQ
ncbi:MULTISPECIES: LysR family transcriptional regulator [Brucella/Ochrobactrum group]|uniref:Transcriptional regulator, LysR family n=1 Tax=Brucella anthropi (strain ATCC 49188 / DSM 6882 / CCUG 24695 / JCM 21032 / LMG 3331 / NBRC 15819 / NCTC 12168 / Alc 37) TaxID=439375 RepID=A6X4F6_BRUA4|nr:MULTISPECIES: LysR family transcriptional regulator [Brucella/Ochrobactrum group]ABS16110.1 transcriptional regulator, LysR family [Brucella anthropi ATCC 49188]AIK41388.1 bacterial regulatory helix-turn-helix, lysR family protein [Brucella anthropi]KAB2742066.1 LysR family transcriptional regulator [Brucella anthropi]KAB2754612.1 LysR family transcriptional regulator [Brucella anthropi]KAB2765278.1 LysR family transcriptional regulator [Brucella anthropi]